MTGNEILQSVDDELGESGGLWNREEKIRWLRLALNRHAREGLSVPAEVKTSSLPGVQEYHVPNDFGELINVRYAEQEVFGLVPLVYVDKQSILSAYGILDLIGTPYACYIFQDRLGLYPVPKKEAVLSCRFEEGTICETFANVPFTADFSMQIEAVDPHTESNPLNPCRVYISHVNLHLRRKGLPYPGDLNLVMTPLDPEGYPHVSEPIPAASIAPRPEWYYFDFSLNPLELNETPTRWRFQLYGDVAYQGADPAQMGGVGVQVGNDEETPWFEMHRLKKDIQIDYYRNTCPPIVNYDEPLELPLYPPERYHPTLVTMVVEKAMRKGQYNLRAAADCKTRADADIAHARSQAHLKTRGDILRVPREVRLQQSEGPYVLYENGRYSGRAW